MRKPIFKVSDQASCLASETSILTFQRLNYKGVDQFVRIHKIVCTYIVGMQQSQDVIFCLGPI